MPAGSNCRGDKKTAEPHPLETTDGNALRFPEAPDLAVATFHQDHVIPLICPLLLFATALDITELCQTVFEHDAIAHILQYLIGHIAQDPDGIFTVNAASGVHQLVGQLAIRGEQQKATGGKVQSAHRHPALLGEFRQLVKYRLAPFGIFSGTDLIGWLVVQQISVTHSFAHDWLAVQFNSILFVNPIAKL